MLEVKVLRLNSSFYLRSLALKIHRKTFQFCKAGKIVSKFIILLLTFYTRSLYCLIF